MRVTNRSATRNYLRYVNKGLSDQAKVQERVGSGNRFEKVSDDVSSGIKAMKARSDQYKMEKQIGNIEDINNVLVAAEDSMQSIDDQLKTVHERFLRAMNGTNENNRNIFAAELKALKEEILQLANSQYNGQYLFSGSNNYGAPFSVDKETGHLVYNGVGVPTDKIFQREDGTYYYETVQYGPDGKPVMKNVPMKNESGGYIFEGGNPKKIPTEVAIKDGKLPDGTAVTKVPATATGSEHYANGNTLYIENPNKAGSYLEVDNTGTPAIDGLNNTPPTLDGNVVVQRDANGNVYEDETGNLYVRDPVNNAGGFYKVASETSTTEMTGTSLQLDTTDPNNITVEDANGNDIKVTKTGSNPDTYEDENGTLFVANEWGTGVKQVKNKTDDQGNVVQEPAKAYKDVPLNEEIYLDVGLGIRMTGSTVDPQTAFNVSYAGPDILGFGVDEKTGLSNNIYNLLNDMQEMLANPDKYSTDQAQEFGEHLLNRLDAFRENVTDLGAKTQFLETMLDRLNKSRDNLEISIGNYTGTDYVEESRHQASAAAVVNALYQLGSNIIPLSLMDFVK